MDIRQLRYFLAVANNGSLSKASEEIPLAQSAISRHIRLLEEELATPLLIRTGRGVALTEQGAFLAERARLLLEDLGDTKETLSAWNENPTGIVRLGMPPTTTLSIAATLLQSMHQEFEQIRLQLSEGLSATLCEWLAAGRLDLALVFEPPRSTNFECEQVGTEQLALIVPKGFSCPDPVSIEDLSSMRLITPFARKGIRNRIADAFKVAGVAFAPTYELDALTAMKDLVLDKAGVAILPRSAVSREVADGLLETRTIQAEDLHFDVFMLTAKSAVHHRAVQCTAKTIRQTVAEVFASQDR